MTLYEGMFVLDPADVAHDWEGLKRHVTDLITRCGGEVLHAERWPDRKLAYEIKGRRKGTHFLTYFHAAGDGIAQLRRECQLSERILRVLVLKNDHAAAEIERRKEAQAQGKVLAPHEIHSRAPAAPVTAPEAEDEGEFGAEEAAAKRETVRKTSADDESGEEESTRRKTEGADEDEESADDESPDDDYSDSDDEGDADDSDDSEDSEDSGDADEDEDETR